MNVRPIPSAEQQPPPHSHRILWYEAAGFLTIILLSWVDELLDLPYRLFGSTPHSEWRESAVETLVVLLVWAVVFRLTRAMLRRLHYLEGLLRMCAWCRKVDCGSAWVSVEEYFTRKLDTKTSHGMCPDCAAKALAELK